MNQKIWVASLVMMIMVATLAVWWVKPSSSNLVIPTEQMIQSSEISQVSTPIILQPTTSERVVQLQAQQQQVAAVVAAQPLLMMPKTLSARPEFVSVVEWEMLQGAAHNTAHPQDELWHLVDRLRFQKMLEQWQAWLTQSTGDTTQRKVLANQLLVELPAQAVQMGWPESEVHDLQEQLTNDVEADATARDIRLQHERQRLLEGKSDR
jgi:hypothetical protein